jgi:thiamine-phosphate pyrophosphorylase
MPIKDARKLVGDSMIIGISAESVDDAIKAQDGGADYIGISPVFSTTTKNDIADPLGLDGVRAIAEVVQVPLVAIDGVGLANAIDVIHAGRVCGTLFFDNQHNQRLSKVILSTI